MKTLILAPLIALLTWPLLVSGQDTQISPRLIHPEDTEALKISDAHIASVLKALPSDAHGLDEVPATIALLEEDRLDVNPGELVGDWKVRSIQGNRLGLFTYPYFKARIQKIAGMLIFEKTTGSQRRSGLLIKHGDGLVLVGGKTVNDDPQRPHSSLGGEREHDTVGKMVKIGPGEFLILLDTSPTQFEIYQLKRS